MRDTVFALATAPGRAAVAVLRVSGPNARAILTKMCGTPPSPRMAALREIRSENAEVLDQGLVIWFPAPKSFTGEDVVEFQLHGGHAVIEAVTKTLAALGARPADPGEFTRRAFEAGRLELSQAEAIADLVDAETDAQRRQALQQLGGALARRGETWRDALLSALAFLGAQMDFPDEDLPDDVAKRALAPIVRLATELETALQDLRGERIREGVRIALIGAPNAGKSSLFNALIDREAAIVTPVPGTTRDVIEATVIISGYKVLIADTAGLRDAVDEVEIEGVKRAIAWAKSADLRLWLIDPHDNDPLSEVSDLCSTGDIIVWTKADRSVSNASIVRSPFDLEVVWTSAVADGGLDALRTMLKQWVSAKLSGGDFPAVTRLRHRQLLQGALEHLKRGLERPIRQMELVAEDVRLAARSLEQLSGRMDPEAVLDRIFGAFCIGK